jgi:hypothetical protein
MKGQAARIHTRLSSVAGTAAAALMLAMATGFAAEKPVAPEHNPPGDIPDNQVFVTYRSSDGYELKAPEGWARRTTPHQVQFADKYDTIAVNIEDAATAPTLDAVKGQIVPKLQKEGRAVEIKGVSTVSRKSGTVIRILYNSNSEPNSVTSSQRRLENERFLYFHNGKLATLDLSAPLGADNADQWQLISDSFRWK